MNLPSSPRTNGESKKSKGHIGFIAYTLLLAGVLALSASCTKGSQNAKNHHNNKPGVENSEINAQKMNTIANRKFGDIFNKLLGEGSNARIIGCPNGTITLYKGKDYMHIEVYLYDSDDIYILYEEGGSYIYKGYKGKELVYKDGDNESCIDFFDDIIRAINQVYGKKTFEPKINFEEKSQNLESTDSIPLTSVLPSNMDLAKDNIESAEEEFVKFFNALFREGNSKITHKKSTYSTITIQESDKTEPIGGIQSTIKENNNYINVYLHDHGDTPGILVGLSKEEGKYNCRFNSSNHVMGGLDPDSLENDIHIVKENVSPEDLSKILQYLKQFKNLLDKKVPPEVLFEDLKQLENYLNNINLNESND